MKMNHTFNRLTAILLVLLLFTENAGILSAVFAEELPFDAGISFETTLEEDSAAAEIPCYESGDMVFDESNNLDSVDDNFLNESNGQDPISEEAAAAENEEPALVYDEATSAHEEQVFANGETAFTDGESAFANEEPLFAEEAFEKSENAAEAATFENADEAAVSENLILTGDTYGEALLQDDNELSQTPAEGSDDSKSADGNKVSFRSESGDDSKGSDSNESSDGIEGRGEISGVLINPLYAHLYDEASIAAEAASFAWDEAAAADYPECNDKESATALVRSRMKERVVSFGFSMSGKMDDYGSVNALKDALKKTVETANNAAIEHTGNPTEGDYISYQYGNMKYQMEYTYNTTVFSANIVYNVEYHSNASQETAVTNKVKTVLAQLNLNGKSEYEKILAIYDYICKNVRYDYAHLDTPTYYLQYTAYAALINGTAVCQGYAVLLYRMLLESGIDCRVIDGIGAGGNHAWNIARIDSLYYNMDATWDAPETANGTLTHKWFLKGKGTSLFPDHQAKGRALEESFITAHPISLENYNPSQGTPSTEDPSTEDPSEEDPSPGIIVFPQRIRKVVVASFKDFSGNTRTQKSYSAQNTVMIYGRSSDTASTLMLKKAVDTASSANTGSKIIFLGIDASDTGIRNLAKQYPDVTFSPGSKENNSTMLELVSLCGLMPQNGTISLPATFVFDRYGNTAYAFTGEEPDKLYTCMVYGSFNERLTFVNAGFTLALDKNIFLYKGTKIKPAIKILSKTGEVVPLKEGTDYKVAYTDNNAPGNAYVTVSGKNGFKGQLIASFRILKPVASLSSTELSLNKNKFKTIYLTVTNGDSVKLSQSNNNISVNALIDNAPLNKSTQRVTIPVTIKAGSTAGTTKIVVTTGTGKKASCTVTVNKTKTKSISVSKTTYKVQKGKTVSLNAKVSPTNSDEPIKYKSEDTSIATVSNKGVVKGKKKGTTKVTITSGNVMKTVTIKVTK